MNNVGNIGCSHLSKSDWPNLATLKIGMMGLIL